MKHEAFTQNIEGGMHGRTRKHNAVGLHNLYIEIARGSKVVLEAGQKYHQHYKTPCS